MQPPQFPGLPESVYIDEIQTGGLYTFTREDPSNGTEPDPIKCYTVGEWLVSQGAKVFFVLLGFFKMVATIGIRSKLKFNLVE